ncbi:MAG: excinuclease ATPase subunit [Comamonadaceae bacterium]|nr:excinuclease ATPase subunit [Comamonadaceae bacterium]
MKKMLLLATLCTAAVLATPAMARDTEYKLPLEDVLTMPEAQGKLDGSVKFYLKGQKTPKVLERKGDDVANKKTNGVGKDDVFACRWAALSALLAFQESAKRHGANAVVDLVSYYKRDEFASPTDYECHAGAVVVGVTLKGTYAKIRD